jgi:pimeloyl-ACP methyl ester carboxylesterase
MPNNIHTRPRPHASLYAARTIGLRRRMLAVTTMLSILAGHAPAAIAAGETAATAETRYVNVGDERLAYRSIGHGSEIILTTRMRGTLDTWDPLFLDQLAERHTVITVDYPGVGYSPGSMPGDVGVIADLILRFATRIGVDRFAVLGWSWGGLVAQALLLEDPARVTHGILIGTNPPAPNPHPMQQIFIERAFKPVNDLDDEEVLFFEPTSTLSRAAAKASHERIYAREGVAEKIPSTPDAIQAYLTAAEGFHKDAAGRREGLSRTTTPLLIISGDNDPATPGQNWYPMIELLGNAQLMMFANAGHAPQHQYPELSAEYIVSFLSRTSK